MEYEELLEAGTRELLLLLLFGTLELEFLRAFPEHMNETKPLILPPLKSNAIIEQQISKDTITK